MENNEELVLATEELEVSCDTTSTDLDTILDEVEALDDGTVVAPKTVKDNLVRGAAIGAVAFVATQVVKKKVAPKIKEQMAARKEKKAFEAYQQACEIVYQYEHPKVDEESEES